MDDGLFVFQSGDKNIPDFTVDISSLERYGSDHRLVVIFRFAISSV